MEKSFVREFTGFGNQNNSFSGTTTKNGLIRTFKDETDLGKYIFIKDSDQEYKTYQAIGKTIFRSDWIWWWCFKQCK